ncbi:putative C2 domain-containing protein 5, partial [Apostichopus japonicus]
MNQKQEMCGGQKSEQRLEHMLLLWVAMLLLATKKLPAYLMKFVYCLLLVLLLFLDVPVSGSDASQCRLCHIPYNDSALPFPVTLATCNLCRKWKVPDVLFTTIEPPEELVYTGRGCCVQARICKMKKRAQGEINAALISDALPFIEFELHRQLMNRLKIATAVYVSGMPPPSTLKITSKDTTEKGERNLKWLQQKLVDTTARNRDLYDLNSQVNSSVESESTSHGSLEEVHEPQLSAGHTDTYVIELDDLEDQKAISDMLEPGLPQGFYSCSTDKLQ